MSMCLLRAGEAFDAISRYSENSRDTTYRPAFLKAAAELAEGGRWVAVCRASLPTIKSAILGRDSLSVLISGALCGSTLSGRNVVGPVSFHGDQGEETLAAVMSRPAGWERDERHESVIALDRQAVLSAYCDDTWILIEMDKDPRLSAFATDPEVFGEPNWRILQEGSSE